MTRPKAKTWINVVRREGAVRQEGQTTKNKVGVGSLVKEELEWENKALRIDCYKVLHVFEL